MSKKKRRLREDRKETPTPKNPPTKDTSPYVHQRDKLDWDLKVRGRDDLTEKQKGIIELISDKHTKIVFINGPAGTSKTWLAVYCGLTLLSQRRMSNIAYIRTVVESASKSLGTLPGSFDEKLDPYLMPLTDKIDEMIRKEDAKRLMSEHRIVGTPVGYLRGASMNAQYIIVEEAQNFTFKELVTALTRLGQYSKMVIIGDSAQADIHNSGFMDLFDLFNQPSDQEQGIHCISLNKNDIVRSGILRHIIEKIEYYNESQKS